MDTALTDAAALENRNRAAEVDPSVAKLQSRWKSAVKKVSTQLDSDVAHVDVDAKTVNESFVGDAPGAPADKSANSVHKKNVAKDQVVPVSVCHPVRASQLRKVNRKLARLQQAWLASRIRGHFDLNDQRVEWQLSLPDVITNPVGVQIGYTPMMVEENAEQTSHETASQDISTDSISLERGDFKLTIGTDSFLLNWVPAPWRSLSVDAKHALLQIALAPLVQALGSAFDEHWHVVGLDQARDQTREKVGSHASSANGANLGSQHSSVPHAQPSIPQIGSPGESEHALIGLQFRCAGISQRDTVALRVPQEWLTGFLGARRDTVNPDSVQRLLNAHPAFGDITHKLPITIGELVLDAKEVAQLGVGDVLFVATHHGSIASFWNSKSVNAHVRSPSATIDMAFESEAQKVVVRKISPNHASMRTHDFIGIDKRKPSSFSPTADLPENLMKNASPISTASPSTASALSDHLAALPIAITIEVGELSLPLSALSDIAVGTTLSLAKPLDEHLLTIRANGHAIAFGELVMLDSEVGVRVKKLSGYSASNVESSAPGMADISTRPEMTPSPDTAAAAES